MLQLTWVCLLVAAGCANDPTPPPSAARVPGPTEVRAADDARSAKPLPPQVRNEVIAPGPAAPPAAQAPSETSGFVDAYVRVGKPRIFVWVMHEPGAARDETAASGVDYSVIQTLVTDWISCGGSVAMISQEAARQALSAQQIQSLNADQNVNGKELIDRVHADVLVMVHAQPTRQNVDGSVLRLVADASNLGGGESIGRAVVDVPPPLDKPQLSTYTHFLAVKLMHEMTGAWTSFGSAEPPPGQAR